MTTISLPGPLLLLGAGRMGAAMLEGWLKAGVDASRIMVRDPAPSPQAAQAIAAHSISLNPDAREMAKAALLVAAVKPQVMDEALAPVAPLFAARPPLVLSIAAGRDMASFKAHFGPAAPVIRAMPNTPSAIGRGITGFAASAEVTGEQKELARQLLAALGEVVEVESEEQIDAVTAVSGSGPAYVFLLAECLGHAGRKLGLEAELAGKLARATVTGAAALMEQSGQPPGDLRAAVTSPGGTTQAALEVLMADDGLCALMERAVAAAEERSRQLAGKDEKRDSGS